jgi:hypothetical protein
VYHEGCISAVITYSTTVALCIVIFTVVNKVNVEVITVQISTVYFLHIYHVIQGKQQLVKKQQIQIFTYMARLKAKSFHPSNGRLGLCVGNGIHCKSL